MNFLPARLIASIFLIAMLALTVAGCAQQANGQESDTEEEEVEVAVPVEVVSAGMGDVYAAYRGTATLEAEQEADVVAKTTGIIQRLLVEEGDFVEEGQVVAILERDRLEIEAKRTAVEMSRMESDLRRFKELYDKKLTSSETYEKAKFDLDAQRAAHELAELELSYTSVRSPISGVITERLVKVGKLVETHQPLFRVDDFDPLEAILFVPERELATLAAGQAAMVYVDALPGVPFEGNLARLSPVVDPTTGTFKVTVQLEDQTGRLKPGMFSRVSIVHDTREQAVVVPREALISEDGRDYVFLVEEDRVKRILVETGYVNDGVVEIRAGLNSGQQIVTSGKGAIGDGSLIEIVGDAA